MSPAKAAVASGLVAITLSACGSAAAPGTGRGSLAEKASGRGKVDDPRTNNPNRVNCLRQHHLPVETVGGSGLQIGSSPAGPTVTFEPTAGTAQGYQIQGREQGAEVIGSALLYPNQASDSELKVIETCLAQGVSG